MDKKKKLDVVIIGAGPAGLAAATKLAKNDKKAIVIEKDSEVGGISKTKEYKGYYFDLGGHRFFTKSKEVNDLWNETLGKDFIIRPRLSRIYYRNKFFNYPIKPLNAFMGLGIFESSMILFSYAQIKLFPIKDEKTFEDWVSNRFGRRLFNHFFKTYTEKVWGIPCSEIQAEWAAQRIKGLSLTSAVKNALFPQRNGDIKTLIDEFQYPKYGPGMMYKKMAENVEKAGVPVMLDSSIREIRHNGKKILSVNVITKNNDSFKHEADYFLSSMPITELITRLNPEAPKEIVEATKNLSYRSFITVSIILKTDRNFPDTWIYVHSPNVKLGRIQNFINWSPYMVPEEGHIALGLEYFCTEGDDFWKMEDENLIDIALEELEKIKLGRKSDFVDGFVIRVPKAYPTYDSAYKENLAIIKEYLSKFENLQPIGRYGMFKYNNMDHSILTGLCAAENMLGARHDVWKINADQDYQEEK